MNKTSRLTRLVAVLTAASAMVCGLAATPARAATPIDIRDGRLTIQEILQINGMDDSTPKSAEFASAGRESMTEEEFYALIEKGQFDKFENWVIVDYPAPETTINDVAQRQFPGGYGDEHLIVFSIDLGGWTITVSCVNWGGTPPTIVCSSSGRPS
ncbi:hypothetical protein [Acrocarpospora sp. B8E8]|uniref:hypothetical protein n=1 Tax=Acrocarpospora sp. B8E8 TaxID=3153572 RepID=UPI00325E54A5